MFLPGHKSEWHSVVFSFQIFYRLPVLPLRLSLAQVGKNYIDTVIFLPPVCAQKLNRTFSKCTAFFLLFSFFNSVLGSPQGQKQRLIISTASGLRVKAENNFF